MGMSILDPKRSFLSDPLSYDCKQSGDLLMGFVNDMTDAETMARSYDA